jgi:hypothetical protein
MADVATKAPGILDKLQNLLYLDYVLKFGGVVMLGIAIFKCWEQVGILTKFLLVSGPVAWYVGARFSKIYR